MFLAGESLIKMELFFARFEVFYGFVLWKASMLWVEVVGVTLVYICLDSLFLFLFISLGENFRQAERFRTSKAHRVGGFHWIPNRTQSQMRP
jgi:hypothetical protein